MEIGKHMECLPEFSLAMKLNKMTELISVALSNSKKTLRFECFLVWFSRKTVKM